MMKNCMRSRFESKISVDHSGCHHWVACISSGGYGRISVGGRMKQAHRVSYELYVGKIPNGCDVLHKCDVRHCVNPDHLMLGSHAENMADMVSKDRQASGEDHGHAKLSASQVIEIRELYSTTELSQYQLADMFSVSARSIGSIVRGELWCHIDGPRTRIGNAGPLAKIEYLMEVGCRDID